MTLSRTQRRVLIFLAVLLVLVLLTYFLAASPGDVISSHEGGSLGPDPRPAVGP